MTRRRILFALALMTAGCGAIIGVPDLELGGSANDGGITPNDGGLVRLPDGAIVPAPDSGPVLTCGPTDADPNNCGRCGRSCGTGNACTAGMCEAQIVASGLGPVYALDLDATYVYYSTYEFDPTGAVQRTKKDGSATDVLVKGALQAVGVHVDGNTLYFGTTNGLEWCDLTKPCAASRAVLAPPADETTGDGPQEILLYQGQLVWTDYGGALFAALPDGGARQGLITGMNRPFGLGISAGVAYVASAERFLESIQLDGGAHDDTAYAMASAFNDPYVAADDVNGVAWAYLDQDSDAGNVLGSRPAPFNPLPLTTSPGHPYGIAVDSANLYWIDGGDWEGDDEGNFGVAVGNGRLLSCPRAGCGASAPTVLATGLKGGGSIAVDDSFVYWVEANYGSPPSRIRRVAKP